jgi:NADH-quinone oxidoreductase subunit E
VTFTRELCQKVDAICEAHDNNESHLLPILQEAQELSPYHYISEEVASYIASKLDVTLAHVSAVISFFSSLSTKPRGENVIQICKSTACLVNGYQNIRDSLEEHLGIKVGQVTEDKMFSLEYTECIGACDVSPAIRINKTVHGNLTHEKVATILSQIRGQ